MVAQLPAASPQIGEDNAAHIGTTLVVAAQLKIVTASAAQKYLPSFIPTM